MIEYVWRVEFMPVLPECFALSIVLCEVKGSKWFSKTINILALQGLPAQSSKPLELLPKRPLVVNIAVVKVKYWVICCRLNRAHVTAYANMNIIVWIGNCIYKTRIICFHKRLPSHLLQLILLNLDIGASANKPKRWALRIDPLLYWGLNLRRRPKTW